MLLRLCLTTHVLHVSCLVFALLLSQHLVIAKSAKAAAKGSALPSVPDSLCSEEFKSMVQSVSSLYNDVETLQFKLYGSKDETADEESKTKAKAGGNVKAKVNTLKRFGTKTSELVGKMEKLDNELLTICNSNDSNLCGQLAKFLRRRTARDFQIKKSVMDDVYDEQQKENKESKTTGKKREKPLGEDGEEVSRKKDRVGK